MKRRNGFSMTELMIVVAIIGIVSVIAYPSLRPIILDNRVKSETRKVTDMLKLARMTALRDGIVTTVEISPQKISLTQALPDGKQQVIRESISEYKNIVFSMNYPSISFASDGILHGNYTNIPTATITDGHNEYYVEVKPSGLAHVTPMKELN